MALEQPDAVIDEEKQAQADFEAGMAMGTSPENPATATTPEPATKPEPVEPDVKPEPPTQAATPAEPAKPKYVRITEEQFATLDAAARRTVALEQQNSKLFGTLGDVQKIVKSLQAQTPRGDKVEVPKDAFAALAKDFPELADQIRAGVEESLKGKLGTGSANAEVDSTRLQSVVAEQVTKLEIEALEDAHPDWQTIVGAVDTSKGEQPDPNNPFRKWLLSKDAAYQARINGSNSAGVIARAIQAFQAETKPAAASAVRGKGGTLTQKYFAAQARQARAEQLRAAIKPRGDGGPPAAGRTDDDDFNEGFNAR